ncbi:MAG: hypothetical protein M0Z53_13260 [Thermaerobacter sp.]|nr:hypothetical protein [Thermaerobacter sp.]
MDGGILVKQTLGPVGRDETVSEWLTIDWQDCARKRFRSATDQGRAVAVDLEAGDGLAAGDVLWREGTRVIAVRVRPVMVLTAEPASLTEMGLAAYHVGNLHQPCLVEEGRLVVPDDPIMEGLFQQLGIEFVRSPRVLARGFFSSRRAALGHRHD